MRQIEQTASFYVLTQLYQFLSYNTSHFALLSATYVCRIIYFLLDKTFVQRPDTLETAKGFVLKDENSANTKFNNA